MSYRSCQRRPQEGYPQNPQPPEHARNPPGAVGRLQELAADSGAFSRGNYRISHRDTNALLEVDLAPGATIKSAPGTLVHMTASVKLAGKPRFSVKKIFTGGQTNEPAYTGPGRIALGPTLAGDIVTLLIDHNTKWKVGKNAYLACTQGVKRQMKPQGLRKAMFSGDDFSVYHVMGSGIMWLASFGAFRRIDLQSGEQHIVDNGHLLACNCDYSIEQAGGGSMESLQPGAGLVCRVTGPGSVYTQNRNMA